MRKKRKSEKNQSQRSWLEHLKMMAWILILGLTPLIGVWKYKWSAYELIMLYLVETWVIGIFNAIKLTMAEKQKGAFKFMDSTTGFFCIHYGLFTAVQTILLLVFLERDAAFNPITFLYSVGLLSAMHAVYFLTDFVSTGKHQRIDPDVQMFAPYGRVLVQQFLAIGGGLLVGMKENNFALLMFLVVLKMGVDYALFFFKPQIFGKDAESYS